MYIPARDFAAMHLSVDRNCKGALYPEHRSIIIHDLVSRNMFRHIVFHEIGHYVFHSIIGSPLKVEWTQKIVPGSKHVTQYARTNPMEDFSESYACYAGKTGELEKIPAKFHFMKKKIFKAL